MRERKREKREKKMRERECVDIIPSHTRHVAH